jgi:hypothetical protein
MGRYYFHLDAADQRTTDDEGADFPDISAARREAEQGARELLAEAIKSGRTRVPKAIVVVDEVGQTLITIPLATVLPKF